MKNISQKKETKLFLIFFIFATLLRFWASARNFNMIYPDEHFQVIEPANWVVLKFGWKAWEWVWGIRSWVVPAFYMPLLFVYKFLGGHGGTMSFFSVGLRRA